MAVGAVPGGVDVALGDLPEGEVAARHGTARGIHLEVHGVAKASHAAQLSEVDVRAVSAACAEECRFHHVCIRDLKIPNIPKQAKQTMWPQNGSQEQVRGGTIRTAVRTVANKHFHASLNPVKVKRVSALMRYSISTLCMRSL